MNKKLIILLSLISAVSGGLAESKLQSSYTTNNTAYISFDVSMPIDSTGFVLKGNNLKGGHINYADSGFYVSPLIAYETGAFQAPIATNPDGEPLIQTNIKYSAIKFINRNGIRNLFIKVGMGTRTQKVSGLDPSVLKNGTYKWQAPIFAFGTEQTTVNGKSNNMQFMQIGSTHGGPASKNVMYTQDFYLYSRGQSNTPISGQPINSARAKEILSKSYNVHFSCKADGLWGAGGADPYRTITGNCEGFAVIFPAGPSLDYVYGTFKLPQISTPWTATPSDHCYLPNQKQPKAGCVNAKIALSFKYMAQRIRVPINQNVTLFAEFGTAYRSITPTNLRYVCTGNMYLKNILVPSDCLVKNYITGGASYPFFAVGYEYKDNSGERYSAYYMNIPGQENGNRLAWLDASNTQIYAISAPSKSSKQQIKTYLTTTLNEIKKNASIYEVLGKNFFVNVLEENNLNEIQAR